MARMSDEKIREKLESCVGEILGSENRYEIHSCSLYIEGISAGCAILYKQEDGSFQAIKIGDKELCHVHYIEFDTSGWNEWTAFGTFRLDYSKIDYPPDKVLEKIETLDWGGDNEWNFTFSLDDDDDDCIAVEIAGEDMSADKDDVPKIQWLNSVLDHIVSEIYNEEFWEE
tara:strand:+ start:48 stop:560 length:513 start_codon:yes stop_codon:yes gene_type:complete